MKVIGLTGGSGCGKSELARRLTRPGVFLLDADALYHSLTDVPGPCTAALSGAFGTGILRPDGGLDRPALAAIVFADGADEKRETLDRITRSFLDFARDEALERFRVAGAAAVILDAPRLFEAGWDRVCDAVIAVTAPFDMRLARIMARDGLAEAAASARLSAQPDDAFYLSRAAYAVCNDGDLSALEREAARLAKVLFDEK